MSNKIARMESFVAAAEANSFSGAARHLGISQSALSKRIAALEHEIGIRLFNRSTRKVTVTEQGRIYLGAARRALKALGEADRIAGLEDNLPGVIRLTAPQTLVTDRIVPMISAFREEYPDVTFDIRATDTTLDLASEGLDLAIRVGALKANSMIARKIGTAHRAFFASKQYLKVHGTPTRFQDLKDHQCLQFSLLGDGGLWRLENGASMAVKGPFRSDNPSALREAVRADMGILLTATWMFDRDIENGTVAEILKREKAQPMPITALYSDGELMPRRVRLFIDFLAAECARDKTLANI